MAKDIERKTEILIAQNFLKSTSDTFAKRIDRKYKQVGESLGKKLKERVELSEDSKLFLKLIYSDTARNFARKINLALDEFKQVNPDAYKQLKEIIDKHKSVRRYQVGFGGEINNQIYIDVIGDILKVGPEKARRVYESIEEISDSLGKKKKKSYKLLLAE